MNHSARFPQFSIAALLGAMIVVGAVLAVFRLSTVGGCAFAAVMLPALARACWAETLRRRASRSAHEGFLGTYFLSLAIVAAVAAASLAAAVPVFVVAELMADWNNPGRGPLTISILAASFVFVSLFWLTRPQPRNYLS